MNFMGGAGYLPDQGKPDQNKPVERRTSKPSGNEGLQQARRNSVARKYVWRGAVCRLIVSQPFMPFCTHFFFRGIHV
jgi:hypothetical protein